MVAEIFGTLTCGRTWRKGLSPINCGESKPAGWTEASSPRAFARDVIAFRFEGRVTRG